MLQLQIYIKDFFDDDSDENDDEIDDDDFDHSLNRQALNSL